MAAITNLTVKKFDGTTDVIYTGVQGSGGDRMAALYRDNVYSTTPGNRPTLTIEAHEANSGKVRRVTARVLRPYLQTIDGRETATDWLPIDITVPVLKNVPESFVQEAVAQAVNLFDHPDVVAQLVSGYAAT